MLLPLQIAASSIGYFVRKNLVLMDGASFDPDLINRSDTMVAIVDDRFGFLHLINN